MTYSFATSLELTAPAERVWNTIHAVSDWKQWWKAVRHIVSHQENGKEITTLTIGTFFYSLTFSITLQDFKEYEYITFDSAGDLVGDGKFLFTSRADTTHLVFEWNVATTKPWMNRYGKLLRPFFVTAHNVVMWQFARGLAHTLHAQLHNVHHNVR